MVHTSASDDLSPSCGNRSANSSLNTFSININNFPASRITGGGDVWVQFEPSKRQLEGAPDWPVQQVEGRQKRGDQQKS